MAISMARLAGYNHPSPSSVSVVCKIRKELLDRLAGVVASLGRAKLALTSAMENRDTVRYESTQLEVERLRSDCASIRVELESHRARHGCGPAYAKYEMSRINRAPHRGFRARVAVV